MLLQLSWIRARVYETRGPRFKSLRERQMCPQLSRLEHLSHKQTVQGSSPCGHTIKKYFDKFIKLCYNIFIIKIQRKNAELAQFGRGICLRSISVRVQVPDSAPILNSIKKLHMNSFLAITPYDGSQGNWSITSGRP